MVEGCQAIAASHDRLLTTIGHHQQDTRSPKAGMTSASHEYQEHAVPDSLAESMAGNMMTTKDMVIAMMNDLPYESNRRLMIEEMTAMAIGIEEFKFKDVSSAIDKLISEGSIASDFDKVLGIFIDKMAASERDKLLILILSQVAVTERYHEYEGIQQLYERTHAKSKCIRYALNLVSKHYDQDTESHLSTFIENLFELVFAGKKPSSIDNKQLIEIIELLVKGLDVQTTANLAHDSLYCLMAVLGSDFDREAERMLATKQADYHRLIDWQDSLKSNPKIDSPDDDYNQDYKEDDHIDFDKKLEELRTRAKMLTEGLQPDDEDEEEVHDRSKDQFESQKPVERLSADINADVDSLLRLRNNFFADAKDLMAADDIDAVSYRQSSARVTKHMIPPERQSAKHTSLTKHDSLPKVIEENEPKVKVEDNWRFEEYRVDKSDQSEELKNHLAKVSQENSKFKTIVESMRHEIDKLKDQKTKTVEVEGLERVIILYKSASNASERNAAMKRMMLNMFERNSDPALIADHLDQCSKVNQNIFHNDLKSILQSMKSVKGLKRTMYEGLLRYAVRCHARCQGSSESINGIINSLVVSQTVEITIDCLIAILRDELPAIDSLYSQCRISII